MSLQKHDLVHEFPEHRERIHALKLNDNHFARLFAEYHETDHAVHRIESGAEAATDERLEALKVARLRLKDQLYAMIKADAA
ncbi:YdcH family protein [Aerophototrophica crusticola]|uniref:YdcH family protein n=1 Tax=Aerophototrophica crusticola TaxID=1709002 RepID=A0A858R7L1_9PROT|nr:YdcH family protein [Rhodospirillaceae bacterium B3]